MMTEALAYDITSLPLAKLLAGGTDPSYSSTAYFVDHYVSTRHFILQLIVSRAQRFAATEFHAEVPRHGSRSAPPFISALDLPPRLTQCRHAHCVPCLQCCH